MNGNQSKSFDRQIGVRNSVERMVGKKNNCKWNLFETQKSKSKKRVIMNLTLKAKIKRLEGFNDQEFIEVLSKLLCEVGVDKLQYSLSDNGYCFALQYNEYIHLTHFNLFLVQYMKLQMNMVKYKSFQYLSKNGDYKRLKSSYFIRDTE